MILIGESMKRTIKTFISVIMIFTCFLTLQSCNSNMMGVNNSKEIGLEDFNADKSDFEVTYYVLPDHEFMVNGEDPDGNFIKEFDYVKGNYWRRVYGGILASNYQENLLIYMQYDVDTYIGAKTYAIENLILSEEPIYEYNGYVFYFNDTATKNKHFLNSNNHPYSFLAFSYNDDLNMLVFFGMYASGKSVESEIDAVADDWPAFLEKYYGEWYSFS